VCIIIKQIVNYWYMIMTNDMYINIEIWVKIRGKNGKIFLCTKKNFSITRNSSKFVIVTFICYLLNYVTLFCTWLHR